MPEHADQHIGTRLREVRKRRGLSQKQLAATARVSVSLIRALEQGRVEGTRMETARRLAVALRVRTTDLLTRDDTASPSSAEPWRALRQAVEVRQCPPDDAASLEGVAAALPEVRAAYFANRLGDLSTLLAPLLGDADTLGDGTRARELRAHLLNMAGSALTQVRQYAAAETALRRALDEATDRHRAAAVVTTWSWLLVRQGRLDEARQLAVRWADDVEPRMSRATPEDLASWGWLLLQASAASLRDNRGGEAADTMRLARAVSVMSGRELGRGTDRLTTWGPLTVGYKAAERYVVLDQPDRVLDTAHRLGGAQSASTEHHRHRLDVAKAQVMMRQYGPAVEVLSEVHSAAPEWLASQRYARDVLADVVTRRRTLTAQMRSLADAVSLPL